MKKRSIIIYLGVPILFLILISRLAAPSLSAQAADTILRPILGEKNTIIAESWYFSVDDTLKRLVSQVKKPSSNIFTDTKDKSSLQPTLTTSLDLQRISDSFNTASLVGEGVWQTIPQTLVPNATIMAKTFLRTDPQREYAIVSLVKIDMQKLSLGVEAGTYYPGGVRKIFGPGYVPKDIQMSNNLLAVFNGGFMERDGHYGMIVGHKTYVPLRKGLATLTINSQGTAKIVDFEGQSFDSSITAIRQNGAFLIKDGKITPFTETGLDTWGRTTTSSMYTWRSGIGITKNGNIIYAVGNSLVPETLAKALQSAGADNAMQLDINPYWVRFIIYDPLKNGNYSYYPLLKDMHNGGYAYLHGYNKDFFYVYKKT